MIGDLNRVEAVVLHTRATYSMVNRITDIVSNHLKKAGDRLWISFTVSIIDTPMLRVIRARMKASQTQLMVSPGSAGWRILWTHFLSVTVAFWLRWGCLREPFLFYT